MSTTRSSSMASIQPIAIYLSLFGVTPWYSFKKQKLVHVTAFKLHSVFVLVALSLSQLSNRIQVVYPLISAVIAMEDLVLEISGLNLSLMTVLSCSFWKMVNWEQLLLTLQKTESKMVLDNVFKKSFVPKTKLYLLFILGNIYLVSLFVLDFGRLKFDYVYPYYFSVLIFRYINFITAYIIFSIVVIIKRGCEILNCICPKDNRVIREDFVRSMRNVKGLYSEMMDIIRLFNILFGWPILCLYFYSLIHVLACLSCCIREPLKYYETKNDYEVALYIHLLYALETTVSYSSVS